MKIIVYTLPYAVSNEAQKINILFKEGLQELHLRKPTFTKEELETLINQVQSNYWNKIVIHSNYDLAEKYSLKGIHVSLNYFSGFSGMFKKIFTKTKLVYTSVFKCEDLDKISYPFHKVMLGPLYKRFAMDHVSRNYNTFEVKQVITHCPYKLVALGGISIHNFKEIASLQFNSCVVQSSIWKSDDYLGVFKSFTYLNNSTENNKTSRTNKAI